MGMLNVEKGIVPTTYSFFKCSICFGDVRFLSSPLNKDDVD